MIKFTSDDIMIRDPVNSIPLKVCGLVISCAHLSLEYMDEKRVFFVPGEHSTH